MFDGLESARSRKPSHNEEVTLKLGKPVEIGRVELDFTYFVNNNPLYVSLHGLQEGKWIELAPKTKVKAFAANIKVFTVEQKGLFEELKVKTYPDGGINRIRVWERPTSINQ